jgi:hypothetical protein
MEYAIGAILGAVICPFASVVGFDKERGFYPVVLIVIEGYYLLFATMAKSTDALLAETIPMFLFTAAAVLGFRRTPWIVVAGLALHGGFDFIRHAIIPNPGVPAWWPGFCLAIDVAMAGYLAVLIRVRKDSQTV